MKNQVTQNALISGVYFVHYKKILRLVLPIVAIVVAAAGVLTAILAWDTYQTTAALLLNLIGQPIAYSISGTISALAVITIIFAVLDYKKVDLSDMEDVTDTLTKSATEEKPGPVELILGIVIPVFVAAMLLGFPQFLGAWSDGRTAIPAFDATVLRSLWLPIIAWAILAIISEVAQFVRLRNDAPLFLRGFGKAELLGEKRHTPRVAAVSVITHILMAVCAVVVFSGGEIMNPAFVAYMESVLAGEGVDWLLTALSHAHLIVLGIALIVHAVEIVLSLVKGFRVKNACSH